jgi:hypothetical protein
MKAAERRTNRSNTRGQALELLVQSCRARGDLRAIVVADAAGLLVADSVGPGVDANQIAALAPTATVAPVSGVRAIPIDCGDDRFYLAFVGNPANDWLDSAVAGSRRILAA